jgi:hypothetical protein
MTQRRYVQLSEAQRSEVWRRWKAGESLHRIGRAFDRPHTMIHCLLVHHGGIVPASRRRSMLSLTALEREDISRGLASGSSIRDIAKGLERAASTVSREVARHGGRPWYQASEADQRAWNSALRPKRCLLSIHVKLRKGVYAARSTLGSSTTPAVKSQRPSRSENAPPKSKIALCPVIGKAI